MNSKNRKRFKILYNLYKEYISLELAYLDKPRPIKTSDAKVSNISILLNEKSKKKKKERIERELRIEAFQNFKYKIGNTKQLIQLMLK